MSAGKEDRPKDIIDAIGDICAERGATVAVSPAYYKWFVEMDDDAMRELSRFVIMDRGKDIHDLVFNKETSSEKLIEMVQVCLRMIAIGQMQFAASGQLLFFKPIGPEPTPDEEDKIEARVEAARGLIGERVLGFILHLIREQREEV